MSKKRPDILEIQDQFTLFKNSMSERHLNDVAAIKNVVFNEKSSYDYEASDDVGIDWVYALQNQTAMRYFFDTVNKNPHLRKIDITKETPQCLDVGSRTSFIITLATYAPFILLDPQYRLHNNERCQIDIPYANLMFLGGEAQDLPIEDNSQILVMSLHAIEHFGLGRYGDTLDVNGDIRGIQEMHRVLSPNGMMIGSVPVERAGNERIIFNRNRVYSPEMMKGMLKEIGFEVINELCILAPCDNVRNEETHLPQTVLTIDQFNMLYDADAFTNDTGFPAAPDAVYMWKARKI